MYKLYPWYILQTPISDSRPVLCYLEGAWTKATKLIDEPFASERHHIEASGWDELLNKINFFSYT